MMGRDHTMLRFSSCMLEFSIALLTSISNPLRILVLQPLHVIQT